MQYATQEDPGAVPAGLIKGAVPQYAHKPRKLKRNIQNVSKHIRKGSVENFPKNKLNNKFSIAKYFISRQK